MPETLAARITAGDVHRFVIPSTNLTTAQAQAFYAQDIANSRAPFVSSYTNALTRWISANCQPVSPEQWQTTPQLLTMQLYECAP
jgi:hypothetical protein